MFKVIVKIDAANSSVNPLDYEFYFQGFTLGQLCEEYHLESLGKQKISLDRLLKMAAGKDLTKVYVELNYLNHIDTYCEEAHLLLTSDV